MELNSCSKEELNMQSNNHNDHLNSSDPQVKKGIQDMLKRFGNALAKDLWIMVLDVVAVNLSYFLALMIRFYVNNQFRPTVSYYLTDFVRFAPFYTVLCIVIFALFKLYNGMWRYAGINDMNRIILASATTCLVQILGTVFFIRRMPLTYYIIGATLQFFFIAVIRFAYRFVIVEHKKIASRKMPAMNVMVIGAGEIGRRVINHLEDDNVYRPVCVIDSRSNEQGKTFDGIPVIGAADGIENLKNAAAKYGVQTVFIADPALSLESRNEVKAFCSERKIDIQDYTGYMANLTGHISLTALLEAARGPVSIHMGNETKEYASGTEALQDLTERYSVSTLTASDSRLIIELKENNGEPYAGYEAWVQKHKEETGEEVSYF